ncbi:putative Branched-chain-amino-acid aminotransferase protein [Naja naja]|nr:putative Branched-chain-amino-acid aminotransferase protein [Naja naja]
MLFIEWSFTSGWDVPQIKPLENLSVHPAISALHYAVELFEGMKAYRGVDGKIRLFRPRLNMDRMLRSAARATLPGFDKELLQCIQKLVEVEKEWVPYSTSASLNYGSSIYAQREAMELGCQQVLWLYGDDHQITEVGTMNLFLYWRNEDGVSCFVLTEDELATPPLDGIILPGVTRQSILDLARKWGEFKVSERYITMSDLTTALKEKRVKEMFGAGTACVNLRIPTMENGPQIATRFWNQLSDIQPTKCRVFKNSKMVFQYGGLLHSFHGRVWKRGQRLDNRGVMNVRDENISAFYKHNEVLGIPPE